MNPVISCISDSSLADTPFSITVEGCAPRTEYTLEMTLSDYYCINAPMKLSSNTIWTSRSTFRSNEKGVIDLPSSRTCFGPHQSTSPMRLFFDARPAKPKTCHLPYKLTEIPLHDQFHVSIAIKKHDHLLAEAMFTRHYQLPSVICREIYGSYFQGRIFYQPHNTKVPGIIVVSGSEGRIEKAQNIAQLLASRGFAALAIAYFGLEGLPRYLNRIPLELIEEAHQRLCSLSFVDKNRIGIYGRSKGAELVLAAQSFNPTAHCIVLNSPSHVVYEGLRGFVNARHSSWCFHGVEVPYQKFNYRDFILKRLFDREESIGPEGIIDLHTINAPMLLLASEQDEIWPAYRAVHAIRNNYVGQSVRLETYRETGHMLTVAYQPNMRYKGNKENCS